jgi:hypothetical protein
VVQLFGIGIKRRDTMLPYLGKWGEIYSIMKWVPEVYVREDLF